MKKAITFSATLFLMITTGLLPAAAQIGVKITPPILSICNSNTYGVVVTNTGGTTLNNVAITVPFDVFIGTTEVDTVNCSGVNTPFLDVFLNLDSIIYPWQFVDTSRTLSLQIQTLQPGDSLSFTLWAGIDCSVIPSGQSTSSLSLQQIWTASVGSNALSVSCTVSGGMAGLMNCINDTCGQSITHPFLAYGDTAQPTFTTFYNQDQELEFIFMNTGNTNGIDSLSLQFDPLIGCSAVTVVAGNHEYEIVDQNDSLQSSGTFIPGDTTWATIGMAGGHTLKIKLKVFVDGCISTCGNLSATLRWRCAGLGINSFSCNNCLGGITVPFSLKTTAPEIEVSSSSNPPGAGDCDSTCFGESNPVEWTYLFQHTGGEEADTIHIQIADYYNNNAPGKLSLIKKSDIVYDFSGCDSCVVTNITYHDFTANGCAANDTNYFFKYTADIHGFGTGDTFSLHLKTFNCSDSSSALYNIGKNFNSWQINFGVSDVCGNMINYDLDGVPHTAASAVMLNRHFSIPADLNLDALFMPQVIMTAVPRDSITGPVESQYIELNQLFPFRYGATSCADDQIAGYILPDTSYKGYLRVWLQTESGLGLEAGNRQNASRISKTGLPDWEPFYYYSTSVLDPNVGGCPVGDYYFYYNLDSSHSGDYFDGGKLHFNLQGCCSDSSAVDYRVMVDIIPNPSSSCCTHALPDTLYDEPLEFPGQTDCNWIPLRRWEKVMHVTCPGCLKPGIEVLGYKMERNSLGLPDANGDLKPDSGATAPLQWQPLSPYKTHYANHGDALLDRMTAQLFQGDNVSGGYTFYDIATANGNPPDVIQLHRKITHGGTADSAMNLKPKSFRLLIDEPLVSANPNCLYCDQFEGMLKAGYDTLYETVWAIEMDDSDTAWSNFVEVYYENGDKDLIAYFTFSHDTDTTQADINMNTNVTFPGCSTSCQFPGFSPMQKYRLMVEYHVCGDLPPDGDSKVFENCYKESESIHTMWITGRRQAYIPNNNFSAPIALDLASQVPGLDTIPPPNPNDTLNDYINTHLFWCVGGVGNYYFLSTEVANISTYGMPALPVGCIRNLVVNFISRIGGETNKNLFPGEYKTPPFIPFKVRVRKPTPNHTLSNFRARSQYLDFNLYQQIVLATSPDSISGFNVAIDTTGGQTWYEILVDDGASNNLPFPVCQNDTSLLRAGHQSSGLKVYADVAFSPCVDGQVDTIYQEDILITYQDYSSYGINAQHFCVSPTVTASPLCTLTLPVLDQISATANPFVTANGLNMAFPMDTLFTYNKKVTWEVQIFNPEVNSQPLNAYHVYLKVPDDSVLTNWKLIRNQPMAVVPFDTATGVFKIADVYASHTGVSLYSLSADYFCQDSSKTIDVLWGWNCLGYPAFDSLSPPPCRQETQTLTINKTATGLASISKNINNYELCTPFDKPSEFTLTQGALYPPFSVEIEAMPPHLFLNSLTIGNCDTNNSLTFAYIPGSPMIFSFDSAGIASAGFAGGFINQGECLEVVLNLTADCAFTGDFPHEVWLKGYDCCQTEISKSSTAAGSSILPGNNPACTQCFTVTKTPSVPLTAPYEPISFQIDICNTTYTGGTVTLADFLPENFVVTSPSPCTWCQTPGGTPPVPDSLLFLPNDTCMTIVVEGYYTAEYACPDSNFNTAQISFASAAGLPPTVLEDDTCITVSCELVSDTVISGSGGDPYFSSELITWNGGNPQITGSTFYVIGTFTVDADIEFINCTLYMAPGAEIVVDGGFSLTTNNTRVSGCTNMWNRIWVLDESYVYILNNSEIRDANDAIWAEDGSRVTIDQSSFYECVRGLFIPPAANPGNFHNITAKVTGSTFGRQNSPGFKPGYSGQSAPGAIPNCGIEVNDMPMLTIGDDAMGTNRFVKMSNGIVAHRSLRVLVLNSAYENIWADAAYNSAHNGSTVVSLGDQALHLNGDLSVRPAATGSTMHHCNRGIYTDYSNLRATGLTMTEMRTGVYSTRCTDMLRSDVSGCSIEANFRGIDWFDNEGSGGMSAIGNSIFISGNPFGVGIETREQNITGMANYRLEYNYISVTNATAGIIASVTRKPRMNCNVIEQYSNSSVPFSCGIELLGCDGPYVLRNHVKSYTSSALGIVNYMSERTNMVCNTVEEQERGIFVAGPCGIENVISGNVMNQCTVGLFYNGSAISGMQEHKGNRWVNVPLAGVDQAINLNTSGFLQSLYIVHQPTGSIFHPQVNPPNWFFHDPAGTPFSCNTIPTCWQQLAGGGDEYNDALLYAIINDSTVSVDYPDESRNMAKRQIFGTLAMNDSLLNSDSTFAAFYLQNDTSSTGGLYHFSHRLSTEQLFDSTFTTLVLYADSLITFYSDSLVLIDSLSQANPLVDFTAQRDSLVNSVLFYSEMRRNLVAYKQMLTDSIRDSVLLINQSIITSEQPELNEREMNNYYLLYKQYGKDSLMTYFQNILSIAHQCPLAGGPSVYRARNFVRMFNDSVEYNDTWVCIQSGYYRTSATTQNDNDENQNSEINLIPNPAGEYVEIHFTTPHVTDLAHIYFHASDGELVLETTVQDQEHAIRVPVLNFVPGVYYVRAISADKAYKPEKLVIIR